MRGRVQRFAAVAGAGLAWFALLLQLALTSQQMADAGEGAMTALCRFLGYFTVLTNLLVALAFTAAATAGPVKRRGWTPRLSLMTGIAANIVLVAIGYTLLLRQIWNPAGAQLVADRLLHDAIPLSFVAYWFFFEAGAGLDGRDLLRWTLWPIVFFGVALIRGLMSGWYPYPFIDVGALGPVRALVNAVGLLVGFALISAAGLAVARWRAAPITVDAHAPPD